MSARSCTPALALLTLLSLTACSDTGTTPAGESTLTSTPRASAPSAAALPSPAQCPPAPEKPWPAPVPADLPGLPALEAAVAPRADEVVLVTFQARTSIREALVSLLPRMRDAGYALGRGDAESSEADLPFVRGEARGVIRLQQVGLCELRGALALAPGTAGAPLLPAPTTSSSPLPFG